MISLLAPPQVWAQTQAAPQFQYFPQTGHNVVDPFLSYFTLHGGAAQYGYPITESYADPTSGLLTQYFQRARLEWHPGNPDPYKIQLGLLGDQLGKREPPMPVSLIPSPSDPACHYFLETGQATCHKFLEYWVNNGGLDQFGYPISKVTIENGLIVQYFQRARMEWHPEKPDKQRIQLGALGQIYFDYDLLDRTLLQSVPPLATNGPTVVGLRARGTVSDAVIEKGASETAYVMVTDQLDNPLSGAAVTLIVHYPTGDQSFTLLPTGSAGTTSIPFPAGKFMPGTVVPMEFIVTFAGLTTTTRSSYLIWFY